jgi:CHAT domain
MWFGRENLDFARRLLAAFALVIAASLPLTRYQDRKPLSWWRSRSRRFAAAVSRLSDLAKTFFYAGARSLLVSHWQVDSDATVKLTTGFHPRDCRRSFDRPSRGFTTLDPRHDRQRARQFQRRASRPVGALHPRGGGRGEEVRGLCNAPNRAMRAPSGSAWPRYRQESARLQHEHSEPSMKPALRPCSRWFWRRANFVPPARFPCNMDAANEFQELAM